MAFELVPLLIGALYELLWSLKVEYFSRIYSSGGAETAGMSSRIWTIIISDVIRTSHHVSTAIHNAAIASNQPMNDRIRGERVSLIAALCCFSMKLAPYRFALYHLIPQNQHLLINDCRCRPTSTNWRPLGDSDRTAGVPRSSCKIL
jgi:hypothetical protein